jgi:hypothetical protein
VNRVIGLTADKLISYGKEVKEMDISDESVINKIYLETDRLILDQISVTSKQGESLKKGKEEFQNGMEDFYETITDYLDDANSQWLLNFADGAEDLAKTISEVIIDIGLNFGFDIPVEESNPELIERLLRVEKSLGDHKPGNPKELAETLCLFLTGEAVSINLEAEVRLTDNILYYKPSGLMTGPVKIHERLSGNRFLVDLGNKKYTIAERNLQDGNLYANDPEEDDY